MSVSKTNKQVLLDVSEFVDKENQHFAGFELLTVDKDYLEKTLDYYGEDSWLLDALKVGKLTLREYMLCGVEGKRLDLGVFDNPTDEAKEEFLDKISKALELDLSGLTFKKKEYLSKNDSFKIGVKEEKLNLGFGSKYKRTFTLLEANAFRDDATIDKDVTLKFCKTEISYDIGKEPKVKTVFTLLERTKTLIDIANKDFICKMKSDYDFFKVDVQSIEGKFLPKISFKLGEFSNMLEMSGIIRVNSLLFPEWKGFSLQFGLNGNVSTAVSLASDQLSIPLKNKYKPSLLFAKFHNDKDANVKLELMTKDVSKQKWFNKFIDKVFIGPTQKTMEKNSNEMAEEKKTKPSLEAKMKDAASRKSSVNKEINRTAKTRKEMEI